MKTTETSKIIRNSPFMILAKTASSILPLLIIVFNFLGLDEDLEGLSILIQYPIYCIAAAMIILLFIALFF